MKYISRKLTEPEAFRRWKTRNKGANWDDFSRIPEHGELRQHLIDEQLGMCCYCDNLRSKKMNETVTLELPEVITSQAKTVAAVTRR